MSCWKSGSDSSSTRESVDRSTWRFRRPRYQDIRNFMPSISDGRLFVLNQGSCDVAEAPSCLAEIGCLDVFVIMICAGKSAFSSLSCSWLQGKCRALFDVGHLQQCSDQGAHCTVRMASEPDTGSTVILIGKYVVTAVIAAAHLQQAPHQS